MPNPIVTRATVYEDAGAFIMARVVGNDAANITQASITGIALKSFVTGGDGTALSTTALTVADVVFDTLQTDARWTKDATGYNFGYEVPATVFPNGGTGYTLEALFDPDTGEDFFVTFEVNALPVMSS